MEEKQEKKKGNFWLSLATFIVDKRKAIEILFVVAIIYSVLSVNKVEVNQDITSYLPAESETRRGLTVMEDEFVTYGSARVMVSNITWSEADGLVERIENVEGVKSVVFDDTEDHYTGANALFDVTVDGEDEDPVSIGAIKGIKQELSDYDVYVSTTIGSVEESAEMLNREMSVILVLAVVIIVGVLLLSTKAYLEIPVLLITFGVAAILNMGTNYWFGQISFVTNSIAVVLQLALAIDYAIILCDRFMEEHETLESEDAVKIALSKAIPEISASSLTTISGMVALMLMQFKLGYDMGIVLVKAILFSLISVFFLMPGILLIFAKGIDKTHHKCYVPKITFIGKIATKTKYIVPPVFMVVLVLAFIAQNNCTYVFDVNSVESAKKSESKISQEKIESVFGASNQLVVIVPSGDYEKEGRVLKRLEELPYVTSALGLANQEINDDYTLTDKISPRQFAEMTDLDVEIVQVLYSAYAYNEEQYGPVITGIDDYEVPIIDMFLFLYEQYQEGYVNLDDDMDEMLTTLYDTLHDAQLQLQGENYSRFVVSIDKPGEGEETYAAMDEIRGIGEQVYGKGKVILAGNSTSAHDLESTFSQDNMIINVMTALFVMIILFFTFQSAGLPVLLVMTIEGSIWINFTIPAIQGQTVYFIAYLIVSAIQMGATIDYAIVISSRYMQLKTEMPIEKAVVEALNQSFPTIFTSGSIMTSSGFLIGNISTDATVSAMGITLGRGTLTSIVLVLFVLPQILLLGDWIIEKTAFTMNLSREQKDVAGRVRITGHVRGYVQGEIDADVQGVFQGQMKVAVDTIIPGRQGQVTHVDEPAIEQKTEEEVIDVTEEGGTQA
ncbi:MAG: MMPL family transporter [Roseburia sp.]|nr:MMPL family transporter [Roseburia sp.]